MYVCITVNCNHEKMIINIQKNKKMLDFLNELPVLLLDFISNHLSNIIRKRIFN